MSGDICVQWSDIFDTVEQIQQSSIGFKGFIEHGVGPVACERDDPENCFVVAYNQQIPYNYTIRGPDKIPWIMWEGQGSRIYSFNISRELTTV